MMDDFILRRPSIPYAKKHQYVLALLLALCLFFQWGCKNKSGITEIDIAPTVRTTTPADNATKVAINTPIKAVFSDNMDPATISGSTFIVNNDTVAISGTVTYADSIATFVPTTNLNFNSSYTATITTDAQSLSGSSIERNHEWRFSTTTEPVVIDTEPPQAVSTNPENNAEEVPINTTISVTFSEPINESTINNNSFWVSQDKSPVAGSITYENTTASFTPSDPLAFGATVSVTVASSIEDTAGNTLGSNLTWRFTTATNPDNTAPAITSTEPTANQENVAPNTVITATFNESMNPETINSSSFTLQQGSTGITGRIAYSGNSATFTPSGNLLFSTLYTATITTAAQDLAGNALADDLSWTFTTGSQPDESPPEIVSTDPIDNQQNVAVNSNIIATFNEPLDRATINSSTFTITQNGTPIGGTISYSGVTAIFNPSSNLPFGTTLEATITTGVQDLAGNALAKNFSWNFNTVQETTPPTIISTSPTDDAENIAVETAITVTFSEAMDPNSITKATFEVFQRDDDDDQVDGTVTYSGTTATFAPESNLSFDETYTATVTTDIQDLAGNNLQDEFTWSFSTAEKPDNTAPEVTATSPANNQANVAVTSNITATFSEPMNPSNINSTSFRVSQNGTTVEGVVNYSGNTATFNPNANLNFGTPITATITTTATDLAGNALDRNISWTFTTERESIPPQISSTSPANNATNVPVSTAVTATFNEAMHPETINGTTFTLSLGGTPVAGNVSYATGSNTATFRPSASLALGTTYTATITTGVRDLAGNAPSSDAVWTFTTEQESTPPEITSVTPADDATNVAVASNITAIFNETMNPETINAASFTITQNGIPISGAINYSGTTATFNPNNNLAFDATITATITTTATDLAGNNLDSNVSWSFTTEQESTAPTVTSTNPVSNAQNVQTNTSIAVNFSEPMDPATINATTFTLTQGNTPVSGNVSYSGTTAIFTPNTNLPFASAFTATITTGAQDLVGNALASNFIWTFITAQETTAPQVTTVSPADGSSNIAVNTNITAGFSEPMDPATINSRTFTVTQDGADVKGAINYSGTTATFNPQKNLTFGSTVTVTITTAATDLAGNSLSSNKNWSFTTELESVPPSVNSTSPINNSTNVPVGTAVTATFNEAMDPATINGTTFTLNQGGSPVAGNVSYATGSNTATFTPSTSLGLGTLYTANITTGAQDVAGNNLEDNFSWSFTTEQESVPPEVTSTSPADGETNVAANATITATFSEPLNPTTINSSTFSLTVGGTLISGTVSYTGTTATFTPDADLPLGSSFTATITSSVLDLVGNPLTSDEVWSFTTEQESTPPGVGSVNPLHNATDVPVNSTISATFDEPMDETTINSTSFILSRDGSAVEGNVSYTTGSNTATFNPSADMQFSTAYTATITTNAQDLAGNNLPSNESWTFTTEQESTPPQISSTSPENNATDVPVNTAVTATFNEAMDPATITGTTFTVNQSGTPVGGNVSYTAESNIATFTPSENMQFNTAYTATVTTGAEDLAGNPLASDKNWTFTTEQESTPPQISSTSPENNATDVPVNTAVTATFNEAMDPATITGTTFTVNQSGTPVGGNVSYTAESNIATFTPSENMQFNTAYTATVTTGAEDLAGNPLASNKDWTFTTEQESVPPSVTSTNPIDGSSDIAVNTNITAGFSEPMDPATINETTFTVTQDGAAVAGTVTYSGTTATFNPNTNLNFDAPITATLTTGTTDLVGNALPNNKSWSFTTEATSEEEDNIAPQNGNSLQ